MKKIVLPLIVLFMALSFSAAEPLTFTAVVQAEGASKDELFVRAQAWFATTFKCGKCVIQTSDKEAGQVIGKGAFEFHSGNNFFGPDGLEGWVTYTVKVFLKDGRYKYEITDFTHESSAIKYPISVGLVTTDENYPGIKHMQKFFNKRWKKLKDDCETQAKTLIESLSKVMASPASGEKAW